MQKTDINTVYKINNFQLKNIESNQVLITKTEVFTWTTLLKISIRFTGKLQTAN